MIRKPEAACNCFRHRNIEMGLTAVLDCGYHHAHRVCLYASGRYDVVFLEFGLSVLVRVALDYIPEA